jgi:hypothetical protein
MPFLARSCSGFGVEGCLDALEQVDLTDRALWYAANPALGHRVAEEFVAAELETLTPAGFARERLGVWPPDLTAGYQVISASAWADARDAASQLTGAPAFAVDVSPDRMRASIAVAGRREDDLRHVEVVQSDAGTGWVVSRLLELRQRWKPCAIVIDPGGPAGSLIADAEAAGIEVVTTSSRDVTQAFGMFFDAVCGADEAARVLRHLGQPELDAAVAGASRRPVGDGHAWNRRDTAIDLTPLVAATNAYWGFAVHGHTEEVEPWGLWI